MDEMPKTFAKYWALTPKPEGDCWPWGGRRDPFGYGVCSSDRRGRMAHRFAYILLVGPIPQRHVIHHECGNKTCCNPAHLRALSPSDHAALHDALGCAALAAKTHCIHGHEYTPENTRVRVKNGKPIRDCRECLHAAQRRYDRAHPRPWRDRRKYPHRRKAA